MIPITGKDEWSGPGASAPSKCPYGSNANPTHTACNNCLVGWAFNTTAKECTMCIPGFYAPMTDMISCEACPAGTECPYSGTATPQPCTGNTYSTLGSVQCVECPEGYNATSDHSSCTSTEVEAKSQSWYKKPGYIGLIAVLCGIPGVILIAKIVSLFMAKAVTAPAAFVV